MIIYTCPKGTKESEGLNMKVWMSISATKFYNAPESCSYGYMYIAAEGAPAIHVKLSHAEAHRQLLKLSRTLGKLPQMCNNTYNPMIAIRELQGYIDRE